MKRDCSKFHKCPECKHGMSVKVNMWYECGAEIDIECLEFDDPHIGLSESDWKCFECGYMGYPEYSEMEHGIRLYQTKGEPFELRVQWHDWTFYPDRPVFICDDGGPEYRRSTFQIKGSPVQPGPDRLITLPQSVAEYLVTQLDFKMRFED